MRLSDPNLQMAVWTTVPFDPLGNLFLKRIEIRPISIAGDHLFVALNVEGKTPLTYAHGPKDAAGSKLPIVISDSSPQLSARLKTQCPWRPRSGL